MHEASESKESEECITCRGGRRIRVQIEVGFAASAQDSHVDNFFVERKARTIQNHLSRSSIVSPKFLKLSQKSSGRIQFLLSDVVHWDFKYCKYETTPCGAILGNTPLSERKCNPHSDACLEVRF
jgi:hypothetical protein